MSASIVNIPRFRITVNGQIVEGVSELKVSLPFGYRIGQFSFSKAFLPADAFPPSWWAATANKQIEVNIELSADGKSFWQTLSGTVDNHRYDAISNTISIAGRDHAAAMCDKRIVMTFRNQTASQIAAAFALEHGLNTNISEIKTLAGRYYDTDHDEIHGGNFSCVTNQWDLLCRLGSEEGITPYVFGNTLYFNRPPKDPPMFPISFSRNMAGELQCNVMDLLLERHMAGARDVVVTVRSWNSRKKAGFSATIRTKQKSQNLESDVVISRYLIFVPNLTQAQCLAKAQQLALDYSRHERNLTATYPSLGFVDPQSVISLSGTGTDYDMRYYPNAVTYSIDFESGARTDISARFSSDISVVDDDTGESFESGSGTGNDF